MNTEDQTWPPEEWAAEQSAADAMAAEAYADAHMSEEQRTINRLIQDAADDGRKLVTVRTIDAIDDIPGADLIKVATVEGWKVVVKAGEFKVGDLCVYFEIDSFLQLSDPRFAFLEKQARTWHGIKGARLRTMKLRGQLSEGLALPLDAFPEILAEIDANMDVGMIRELNFTATVGAMKWEQIIAPQLQGKIKGNFPSFLRKSDQERAQNMGREIFGYEDELHPFDATGIPEEAVLALLEKGELVWSDDLQLLKVRKAKASRDTLYEVTLKLDGSSMTIYTKGDDERERLLGVCSRNLDLKLEGNEDNAFVQMAQTGLLEVLRQAATNVAVQGELMGPGIQGNREGFTSNHFFVYNVFDISTDEFMRPNERHEFIRALNGTAKLNGLPVVFEHVPVIARATTLEQLGISNMEQLLAYAVGPSMNHPVREGLVFKALDGHQQFKVISSQYLLKEKD